MADWYASSAAYAAIPAFAVSTAYTVGQIVKPITPGLKASWAQRCTTAGTSGASEPTWNAANNGTTTTGTATFTNVTGQGTYAWSAAAGTLASILDSNNPRFNAGDRVFVSSDHAETQTSSTVYGASGGTARSFNLGMFLSVNRAGSVPPVAADLTPGATITVGTGASFLLIDAFFPTYHYGINYVLTSTGNIQLASSGEKSTYFDGCQLYLNTTNAGSRIVSATSTNVILNNTTLRFGSVSHAITTFTGSFEILWLNTPAAIAGAIIPTTLFSPGTSGASPVSVTARGVDLSAITGTLIANNAATSGHKYLFDSCRIAPGVVRYNVTGSLSSRDVVEFINCYDGTNIINESYRAGGTVTTERTITLSGGATDDVGVFSHKLVSNTNLDKYISPLVGFWLDIEQQAVGSSKTATVEIISSASLNNDEISLLLEYQGTAGSSVASIATTLPATALTTAAAVTASSATWNASPATPVKQKLVVTFTPQVAGRVRGQVRLGKASATVYYNPVIMIA